MYESFKTNGILLHAKSSEAIPFFFMLYVERPLTIYGQGTKWPEIIK